MLLTTYVVSFKIPQMLFSPVDSVVNLLHADDVNPQILAGLLNPTSGDVSIRRPRSFVFQNPDHQVLLSA